MDLNDYILFTLLLLLVGFWPIGNRLEKIEEKLEIIEKAIFSKK